MNHVEITEKEFANLYYSFLDDEGVEHNIPVRWDTFYNDGVSIEIVAALDSPVGGFTMMSVLFDHFNRNTSVELADEHGSTHHMCWDMSPDMRGDLYHAVKFLTFLAFNTSVVHEWSTDNHNTDEWDDL